ncbi:DUF2975 domain-containing protein [Candidiatus Paracoxiella cheracis]|uniref:DUF2975 domain-containing protein n=1 Tax=Candidiatus Paracoxiella cheracis TaxID=3405120 RepID=UPI003BF4D1E3
MDRIRTVSQISRTILLILFWVAPIVVLVSWLTNTPFFTSLNLRLLPGVVPDLNQLPPQVKCYGFLTSLIPTAASMIILYSLACMFKHFERGNIFGINSARCLKIVGITILIWEIIHPFYDILMSYVLTHFTDHTRLAIQFDISNLRGLIIGIVLFVIAWVMEEAAKLKEEQDLTV